jgi:hypothetical protein
LWELPSANSLSKSISKQRAMNCPERRVANFYRLEPFSLHRRANPRTQVKVAYALHSDKMAKMTVNAHT